jgi:hypothetical protein
MASPKSTKAGALDAFWEKLEPSSPVSPISDLLQSLSKPTPAKRGGEQRGADAHTPSGSDLLFAMVQQLVAVESGWTVAEIAKNTGFAPGDCIAAVQKAMQLGLIAENNEDPERKRFRVTAAGRDLAAV